MEILSRLERRCMESWLSGHGPGLRKGVRKNKKPRKRRILQCFLVRAGVHDRTDGTNILKIVVTKACC